jgi:hypothetical protein
MHLTSNDTADTAELREERRKASRTLRVSPLQQMTIIVVLRFIK